MHLTDKQEAFARLYVETSNASHAYRQAYDVHPETLDKTVWECACKLAKDPKVAARLVELRAGHQKRHEITVDRLTAMLIEDRDLAREKEMPAAAVSAVMGLGKLHGLIIEKKEVTRKRDVADLSLDELYDIATSGSSRNHPPEASASEPDSIH